MSSLSLHRLVGVVQGLCDLGRRRRNARQTGLHQTVRGPRLPPVRTSCSAADRLVRRDGEGVLLLCVRRGSGGGRRREHGRRDSAGGLRHGRWHDDSLRAPVSGGVARAEEPCADPDAGGNREQSAEKRGRDGGTVGAALDGHRPLHGDLDNARRRRGRGRRARRGGGGLRDQLHDGGRVRRYPIHLPVRCDDRMAPLVAQAAEVTLKPGAVVSGINPE
mmetsp:Transcript_40974/g.127701  ORF Transcript_40974/g.127701 Transcript_40974/m.127701 type:complete len:219 (+) Transcript_40974:481-1137(+)